MSASSEYIWYLKLCNKALERQLESFRSGSKYQQMRAEFESVIRHLENENRELKAEVSKAHVETVQVRKNWSEIFDDLDREHREEISKLLAEIKRLRDRCLEVAGQRDRALDEKKALVHENYELAAALEDEKGRNMKLTAQLRRDYETSSKPSSSKELHKKIQNSREKTGRKPGAQPGHEAHLRRKMEPTEPAVELSAPENIINSPDYYATGKERHRQVVDIEVRVKVTDYIAKEYRNRVTGSRYYAAFPSGVINEVNYGSDIKALAFFLNDYCNVSVEKTQEFISNLTGGNVRMSAGMINGLAKEFSAKTETERKKIFATMLQAPVVYTDATVGRTNGKGKAVFVCATPEEVLYFHRDRKGHEGIKGTVVEEYQQTLVHDHDKTFYNYGNDHQECLAHVLRYLKDSMQNEPERVWNRQMHEFLQRMIHEVKEKGRILTEAECLEYEQEYLRILDTAVKEYEYEPPSDYYRDGYNLQKRMREYSDSHLYFLRHPEVDYTNNEAERDLRKYKRKQKQQVTFRSDANAAAYCDALSIIETGKRKSSMPFQTIKNAFTIE